MPFSWLNSLASCCSPTSPRLHGRSQPEKDMAVWADEPSFTPPPMSTHARWQTTITATGETTEPVGIQTSPRPQSRPHSRSRSRPRSKAGSLGGRRSQSAHRRFQTGSSSSQSVFSSASRRPQISAPTNFRHVHSESFAFPPVPHLPHPPHAHGLYIDQTQLPPQRQQLSQRPPSFHPLELSIYATGKPLSPLMPGSGSNATAVDELSTPSRTRARGGSSGSSTLTGHGHDRGYSSMSFHVPRRPLPEWTMPAKNMPAASSETTPETTPDTPETTPETPETNTSEKFPPPIPPRSRMRAYSSPAVETMVERIAGAMLEMEKLQADIDAVVERQSLYVSSRPTTACEQFAAVPSIPALPPTAPSFAERLSTERPKTAPPCSKNYAEPRPLGQHPVSSIAGTKPDVAKGPRINGRPVDVPLAPPLPLVLRPPLRKKKSFSRVSRWLLGEKEDVAGHNGHNHSHSISLDSVTNLPRPVTNKDGFYQCVLPTNLHEEAARASLDSESTLSTWTTDGQGAERVVDSYNRGGQREQREQRAREYSQMMSSGTSSHYSSPVVRQSPTATDTPTPTTATTLTPIALGAGKDEKDKASMLDSGLVNRPPGVGVAY